jgi:hypothetical protein
LDRDSTTSALGVMLTVKKARGCGKLQLTAIARKSPHILCWSLNFPQNMGIAGDTWDW